MDQVIHCPPYPTDHMLDLFINQVSVDGRLDLVLKAGFFGYRGIAVLVTQRAELGQQVPFGIP